MCSLFAQDPDDRAVVPESAREGKLLFQQSCGFCHGPDGRGASGPDLLRSSLVSHDESGNLIGPVVRNGRPDKGMPSFPFSEPQIQQIVQFLHAESKMAATITRRNAG